MKSSVFFQFCFPQINNGMAYSHSPPLVLMVRDAYANYVIQKILERGTSKQRTRLVARVKELVPNLRKLMFGKHIIAKIERITGVPQNDRMPMR